MPDDPFRVTAARRDGTVVLALAGTINRAAKEQLEAAYDAADARRIVLDFTAVDYINSTGIAVVVGLLAKARSDGREIAGYGLTDHYREVFRITRLADFIAIHDTQEEAMHTGARKGTADEHR